MSNADSRDAIGARRRASADRLLLRVARHGGPPLALLGVTAFALAAFEAALPAVLGRAVDSLVGDAPRSWITWTAVVVAVLVAFDALDDIAAGATTARSTSWVRRSLLRHILSLGLGGARRFDSGDVASRLVGNAADAGRVAPDMVRAAANTVPALAGTIALALIHPWLCATFLVGAPVLVPLVRAFARDASDSATHYLDTQAGIAGGLAHAVSGARTIASAGTMEREAQRVLSPLPELHRHGLAMWRATMRISTQDALVAPLLQVAVLAVAGALLARGRISPGEMLAAAQYAALAATLGSAVTSVARLARARAGARRVADVLDQPAMAYGPASLPRGRGHLEFRAVTVRSGDVPVLDRLDLVVPAGKLVAVVGASGSGKSLLAALAGRLIDPDEGEVLLDGVALPLLTLHELRRNVTFGFERPALLGETVGDAIAFGARRATEREVLAAAGAARADAFIRRMPDGFATRLPAPMSGGEAQRVGLARAFAHAGRVLVLDDVAASLDTVTEHHIGRVLTGALGRRTRLVVAHRASTAARADAVAWLEGGRVRAVAPHRRLWADPDYRSLFGAAPAPVNGNGNGNGNGS